MRIYKTIFFFFLFVCISHGILLYTYLFTDNKLNIKLIRRNIIITLEFNFQI